jgi:putative ABC transport system permease protein
MPPALYRLLLRLYPASFRAEYGREMVGVFVQRYRRQSTAGERAAFWVETIRDVISNAPAIHWDILRQDLRGTTRTISRTPGFSITVMLVAALGIGATTAAFSLADHVLIRPLPFPEPNRVVKLWQDQSAFGYARMELSPPNFRDWRRESTSFDGMAAYQGGNSLFLPDSSGLLARVDGATTVGDVFGVLRVRPVLGRTLNDDDDRPGAPVVILLSDDLWRTRFNADPAIVGQTIAFADMPRTVIGVMPPSISFPNRNVTYWVSMRLPPAAYADDQRANFILNAIARLKPGVSSEAAGAELNVIARRLAAAFPRTNSNSGAVVLTLRDELTPQARLLLWGLVAAAVALLLIACTNLANLLLSKSLARQRELAVRSALGAGRHRLVRQTLTETLTLAGAGGAIGIMLAIVAVPFVARLVPTNLPIEETPSLDFRMIAAALIATLATAAGVGVIPAMRVGRHSDAGALREGARAGTSRRTERMRSVLVVAEIAASIALLVSTGLLVRALLKVQQTEPGFRADGVLTMRITLPSARYRDASRRLPFYDGTLSEVRALPGVTSASYITWLPMVMRGGIWPVSVDGNVVDEATAPRASFRQVTPGFFATMETPITRGRDFNDNDGPESLLVAMVSESFVQRHWPDRDPIGRPLTLGGRERTVVGVAGDIRVRGLERESEPQVYIPATQGQPFGGYYPRELVVRSSVPPASLTPAIRAIITRADPEMPIADVRTLRDIVDGETAPRRVQVNVLASFAAIAFLLAAIGLHGLLSFNVSSRAREIGVRMALGARRESIVGMIVKDAVGLAVVGVVVGAALAFAAGRGMQALLAGVSPLDPVSFAGAVLLAAVMTLAGTILPTLRAVAVDPIAVIRTE